MLQVRNQLILESCALYVVSKRKGTKKLHRICEGFRAEHFLAAIEFNKDKVYQRCIYRKSPGDLYAADVIYHGNSLHEYLLSFDREIKRLSQYRDESAGNSIIQEYTIVIDEDLSNLTFTWLYIV